MGEQKLNKREFLKLLGMGSLGLLFWQCYDVKKDSPSTEDETLLDENENLTQSNLDSDEIPEVEFSDKDVIFLERNQMQYDQLRLGFNKRFNRFPNTIAICFTTLGVQAAVQKANKENLKVSIKSGGHSFESFSCTDDSLLIHLSNMNKIEWLNSTQVLLQPACLLQEIYDDFLPKKRIIPCGSCGTVAVGGLTLGGGYGFFSRKYGLTSDHLYRVKLVDGKGRIHDSDENPEILWACKGGGNGNFGVVTEMYFNTETAPESFSSYRLKFKNLKEERFMKLIRTWFKVSSNLPKEAFSAFVLNGKTLTVLITNFTQHKSEFEKSFEELKNLADEYSPTFNQNLAQALKRYYGRKEALYFKNASAGLYKGIEEIETILPEVFKKVISKSGLIYQINTLGGEISNPDLNSLSAYPHRDYPYLSELQSYWDKPTQEASILEVFEEVQQLFTSIGITAQYRNYPDINFKSWKTAYYGSNYKRLQNLKSQLDSDDLFHFEQSIRPKGS